MRATICVGTMLVALGCGGGKAADSGSAGDAAPPPVAVPADPVSNPAAMPPDTTSKGVPPAGRAAGTPPPPLRDSAFGPKFTVDSTGKVTPIKRPPS